MREEITDRIRIRYFRPPRRLEVFTQQLILDKPDVKVTLARDLAYEPPIRIRGEVALEEGSDAVWFTFPGRWHDIGRFHRADGSLTGIYANILTPPEFRAGGVWETTDLYLDIWLPPGGGFHVLDEDQLEEARDEGWISEEEERRATAEVLAIRNAHRKGRWPPPVVGEWTLDRALEAAGS